jgi:hypothetical protein
MVTFTPWRVTRLFLAVEAVAVLVELELAVEALLSLVAEVVEAVEALLSLVAKVVEAVEVSALAGRDKASH